MKRLPYGQQLISDSDIAAVVKILKSELLTQGPAVDKFETDLARYTKAKYAVVFNSGTAALHAAYFAIGLSPGDEFITSPMTFAATTNAGLYLGAKPVFVDIDGKTGNLDIQKIEAAVTPKTRLIVPVHYAGQPVLLEKIHFLAKKYKLKIVDDACHALGAELEGHKIGSGLYSNATVFSFHPVKHITTGEGGALLTNDEDIYSKALQFRTHGITKNKASYQNNQNSSGWYHEMQSLGFNYRMPDILAALGSSQLKKIDAFLAKRRHIAQMYDAAFAHNPYFDIPPLVKHTHHAYHLYPILLKAKYKKYRQRVFDELVKKGLGVQVHYIPVYQHPYYQGLGYSGQLCPLANEFYDREISIPLYPGMTSKEVARVIKTILEIFENIKPHIGAIIQCRADSKRLPNKIFNTLPYGGSMTVLDQVISHVKKASFVDTIVVATTTKKSDDRVVDITKNNQVSLFRGSEDNVLDRFYQTAKLHNLDVIVRITADCPCLDPELIDKMINIHLKHQNDITTNTVLRRFPRGLDVEIINFSALETAFLKATTDFEKEHVTHYLYHSENNNFRLENIKPPASEIHPELRLTLDTPEDYAFLCEIFENLSTSGTDISVSNILKLLEKKPWLKAINKEISLRELNLTTDQQDETKRQRLKLVDAGSSTVK